MTQIPESIYTEIAELFDESLGRTVAFTLARHFGGQQVYLPTLKWLMMPDRDQEIRSKFKGHNLKELAREYGLSQGRVREILAAKKTPEAGGQGRV